MRKLLAFTALTSLMILSGLAINQAVSQENKEQSVYDFKVKDIDGKEVDLKDYAGKVLLIVNVASKCGYTPQYTDLVQLQEELKDEDFVVLGFPANEFGQQEPGTNEEIKEFCTTNYKVDFPMFSKVVVKGEGQTPLFEYLTTAENPDFTGEIKWNFEKFLIGKDGTLLHRYRSKEKPTDERIKNDIQEALKAESK